MKVQANRFVNSFTSLEPIRPRADRILWDSGCSHIMFNQAGAFIDLNRQIKGEVKVADGKCVPYSWLWYCGAMEGMMVRTWRY